ncbi:MAG: hypothetical protein AAF745_04190 [Planctomycetota bacterium]
MGGTIRCLMVATIVITAANQPSHAQSADRAQRIRAWKPQGFDIPDSLREQGSRTAQSQLDRAQQARNTTARNSGSGGQRNGMEIPKFTSGVDPRRATQRTGGPSTDPMNARDQNWSPNLPDRSMPSTEPAGKQPTGFNTASRNPPGQFQTLPNTNPGNKFPGTQATMNTSPPDRRFADQLQPQRTQPQRSQQPAQQRLGTPSADSNYGFPPLSELNSQDIVNVAGWLGISSTDERLSRQDFIERMYATFINDAQTGKIELTGPFAQRLLGRDATTSQSNPNMNYNAANSRLANQQAPNPPALGQPNRQATPNQQLWAKFADSATRGSVNNPANPSSTAPPPWNYARQQGNGSMAGTAVNSRQTNQYDPNLTREQIARLPPNGYTFDKYGFPLNRKYQILDSYGYVMDSQEAQKMTLARIEKLAREKQEAERAKEDELLDRIAQKTGVGNPNVVYRGNAVGPNLAGFPNRTTIANGGNASMYPAGNVSMGNQTAGNGQPPMQTSFNATNSGITNQPVGGTDSMAANSQRSIAEIDRANMIGGGGKSKLRNSNPYVNVFLLCSLVSNGFLFVWLHRLWHHHRDLIAQNRIATSGISVES